ncbi:MAG: preprotein translocase subunit YajC [Nitrososphaerales archaeon]
MIPFILAQQGSPPQSGLFGLLPFILIAGIFYLLIIRPMRSRQKNLESLIASLKNGDKVITTGGVYGTIAGVRDNTFLLKVADQVKMEVAKNAVASLQSPSENSTSK